jgi:hypothetical protein
VAIILVAIAVFGAIGYAIGRRKGRGTEGLVLGLMLGIIGLAILAFLKPRQMGQQTWNAPYPQQTPYDYPPPDARQQPFGAYPPPSGAGLSPESGPAPFAAGPAGEYRWVPDPTGRYEQRLWDGQAYTAHVSSNGQISTDPLPISEGPAL